MYRSLISHSNFTAIENISAKDFQQLYELKFKIQEKRNDHVQVWQALHRQTLTLCCVKKVNRATLKKKRNILV